MTRMTLIIAALLAALVVAVAASAAPATHFIGVKRSSLGGTVTSSASIDCGFVCWGEYSTGTQVTLEAHPAFGWKFIGWSWDGEACGEAPVCTVTADADKYVMAEFVNYN